MKNEEVLEYIKSSFKLKEQGFYKPAIEMLYKAISLSPNNIEILAQLACLYKLLNNPERAIDYVEKVLELAPNHLDSLYLLEDIYLGQGEFKKANEVGEKIFKIQPNAENLTNRIKTLLKLGDFETIKSFENSEFSNDENVLFELANAYFLKNELEHSFELLKKAYEKGNDNTSVMKLLAKIYYEKKDFVKAKEIFKKLENKVSDAQTFNYLGLLMLDEQDFLSAINYFSKATSLEEGNAEYYFNLGSAYFCNGWLDEALKSFNNAICSSPDNANYRYSLAYLYYQKADYEKALNELKLIKRINPEHKLSIVLSSMISAKNGNLLGAKSELENITKTIEDDFAFYGLGVIYKELSMYDKAKEAFAKASSIKPKSLNYLSELVSIEILQKNYDEALKIIEKIFKINDKYISAYIYKAKIEEETKDFENMYDTAQDIIELDSNTPEGYYYNALALFKQGDTNFAIESLKKSISLDVNNAILYITMSEFFQKLGDTQNAYDWVKEACEIDEKNYNYKWLCAKLAHSINKDDEALKNYSTSFRIAPFDNELKEDYANFLKSIGKDKQAEKVLAKK